MVQADQLIWRVMTRLYVVDFGLESGVQFSANIKPEAIYEWHHGT
jgi:hypothetical protein